MNRSRSPIFQVTSSGYAVEVAGTVTERLDGNRVAIDVTARTDGAKVLTRARAVVRLA